MCCSRQMSAIAATGSIPVDDVVPMVATTATGVTPARRSSSIAARSASARMLNVASTAIFLNDDNPKPSVSTALSIDECACSEQ